MTLVLRYRYKNISHRNNPDNEEDLHLKCSIIESHGCPD